jgi:hypothetical protein
LAEFNPPKLCGGFTLIDDNWAGILSGKFIAVQASRYSVMPGL